MNGILTILAFSIGGLWVPLVCAAIAIKKHKPVNRWFALGCLGLFIAPLIGGPIVVIVLACLPKGTESGGTHKLFGLTVTAKSLAITSSVFAVIFAIGCAGLISPFITIINAIK